LDKKLPASNTITYSNLVSFVPGQKLKWELCQNLCVLTTTLLFVNAKSPSFIWQQLLWACDQKRDYWLAMQCKK